MNIAVRYYSKAGSTQKIAEAIADAVGVKALSVDHPLTDPVDILFLGGAPYGGSAFAPELRTFIQSLTAAKVKSIAAFSTSNWKRSVRQKVIKELRDESICVLESEFLSRGAMGIVNSKRPTEQDCAQAAAFAERIING